MPERTSEPRLRPLVLVAAVSGLYDVALGLGLLFGRGLLQAVFSVPAPTPPIHADLNGLFLLAIGVGYALPYRRPDLYRGYLWVMGPLLKGAGSLAFVLDHLLRGSPNAYLVFSAADGSLALATWWALRATRARRP
jgi:hypothetical protein